jgi:asparagine synthase (glutamine-hydrolysing)
MARRGDASRYRRELQAAIDRLAPRGPDADGRLFDSRVALGHRRLAIIDTSAAGNQPMTDRTGRYTIVYNGEIYNYRELRQRLIDRGVTFDSQSDSEVVLQHYIAHGPSALDEVNGFFAFAVYDNLEGSLFLARDRLGIKPLFYCEDDEAFVFASELNAILPFPIGREIDDTSLFQYLQLSYVPAPYTILRGVRKLEPGCYLVATSVGVNVHRYYQVPYDVGRPTAVPSFGEAKERLVALLEDSVRQRLVSDVPLGAFLSGGVDSTIIAALAAKHVSRLKTFSIGFEDEAFYDETPDALAAARAIGTDHTVFRLRSRDLYEHLFDVLDGVDEPFADSSAMAVYILSRRTRGHVKVALSGDGADELFGGYNKHYAEYRARSRGGVPALVRTLAPLWEVLPRSRDSAFANRVRQLRRFARTAGLPARERYWDWCKFTVEEDVLGVLSQSLKPQGKFGHTDEYERRVDYALSRITDDGDINDIFYTDVGLVLQNDMLHKVDSMSMANSLEVRVPYLDHRIVEFCFALQWDYKIGGGMRKRILKEAFARALPGRVLAKPKHGFEVPLMPWFRGEMRSLIADDLLEDTFVTEQGIFDPDGIRRLKSRLFSARPGDVAPLVWALVVFQYWWKKYVG